MSDIKIRPAEATGGTIGLTVRILRWFLPGELRPLLTGFLGLLIAAGLALLQPWPLKLVLDSVIGERPIPAVLARFFTILGNLPPLADHPKLLLLVWLCLGVLLIQLFLGVVNVFSAYVLNTVGLRLVFKVRCALFDHLQRLSLAYHDAKPVGDSIYRVVWDSYCVQSIFSGGLIPAFTATVTLTGIGLILLSRDWLLTVVTLGVAVPLVLLIRRMEKPMTEQSTRVHALESAVSTRVQETLSNLRAVLAFGRERLEGERFRKRADASLRANLRLTVTQTASQAIVGLVLAAGTTAVIWIGARGVLEGRLTGGDLVLLVAYVAMILKPLEMLAYTAATIQNAAAGARRVLAVLDAAPNVADAPSAAALPGRADGSINLEAVSFGYSEDRPVLQDFNLQIPAGSTVAIVGVSGAGKSTVANLILRFYDPQGGRILLDGHDLRSLTLSSLRQNIALVSQEPILFCASVRENIAYGRPEATLTEIQAAARAAGAHEFIEQLPQGYETCIAERGSTLSSGQRQRLTIARAFLKNAPVLILDEPTSALDAGTEELLLQTLEGLMRGRTTIIISHRLSTIRRADRIIVLQEGRVGETGSHAELLERGQLYARLHQLQFVPSDAAADMSQH